MNISSTLIRRSLLAASAALVLVGAAQFADAQGRPGGHGAERFEEADLDGDGVLSLDEMLEQASQRFEETDADGDGFVSQDEMRAHRQERRAERGSRDGEGAQGECGGQCDGECGGREGRGGRGR